MQTFSYGSQDSEFDYQVDYSREQTGEQTEKSKGRTRRPSYARVSVAPSARNGIHRRRNKRWSW